MMMPEPLSRGRFNYNRGPRVRGGGRGGGRGGPGPGHPQQVPVVDPMFANQRGWGRPFCRGRGVKRPAPVGVVGTGGEASVETGHTQQNVPEKKEKPSITQLSPSQKVTEQDLNLGHSNEDLQRFFSGSLRGMNPTGWVTEMAKRKGWFVHGKEGSSSHSSKTTFNYTVKLGTLSTIGYGTKKKDAKNLAFRLMAIKFGEEMNLLPPLSTQSEDQQVTAEPSKLSGDSPGVKAAVDKQVLVPCKTNTQTEPVPCNPNTLAAPQTEPDTSPVPENIQYFSAGQMVTIPGHPVVAFNDLCKGLQYGGPQYVCVREEKVAKIGIYWKFDFTTRVTVSRGQERREFYGKAATKKDSKNQAAAAGYFGLKGSSQQPGELPIMVPGPDVGGRQTSVQGPEAGGRPISVLGSAVPLPAPPALPTRPSLTVQAPAPARVPSLSSTPGLVPPSLPASCPVKVTANSQNSLQTTPSKPPSLTSNSQLTKKSEPTLDDCLHDFENFLSDLEADVNKKSKQTSVPVSTQSSSTRSRRRTRSVSRSRSRSRRRSRSRSGYRSRYRRSRSRSSSYDRRYRSRSRERESFHRGRDRSVERYNSRHYDDYYDEYEAKQRRVEDRRGRY